MNTDTHLLIVDDDEEIRSLLKDFLNQYGYRVSLAQDGKQMHEILGQEAIDLMILDVMMPGDDGFTLCKQVRTQSNLPIIMLTAIGSDTDRIIGLEIGADDYIPKPFNTRELLARIKAILRRTGDDRKNMAADTPVKHDSNKMEFKGWILNIATRTLTDPEELEVSLSAGEYDLLVAFLDNPQRVLSRDQLLDITKNREAGPFDRSIDVQISRLRYKIEADPKSPLFIKTVRGGGYLFTPDVARA